MQKFHVVKEYNKKQKIVRSLSLSMEVPPLSFFLLYYIFTRLCFFCDPKRARHAFAFKMKNYFMKKENKIFLMQRKASILWQMD